MDGNPVNDSNHKEMQIERHSADKALGRCLTANQTMTDDGFLGWQLAGAPHVPCASWLVLVVATASTGLPPVSCAEDKQQTAAAAAKLVHRSGPVAVDLNMADPDTRKLLESMLEQVRANPASGEARGQLGMAYEINGYGDAALVSYEQAEALGPKAFLWPYFRALLLGCHVMSSAACSGQRIDYVAALQSVDRALAIDAAYVPAWLWRGAWLQELGRLDEAAAAYRRARELGGEEASAAFGLARILLRQGRPGEALAVLEPRTGKYSHPAIYRLLGRSYQLLGRAEDAHIAFARGRKDRVLVWRDPREAGKQQFVVSYGGRLQAAVNALEAGQYGVAVQHFEALRGVRPDNPDLLRHLGTAYLRVGQRARARDVLRRGLEIDPDNYHLNLHMAGVYREAGLPGRALAYIQRAIDAVPARGRAHYLLARILMDQGKYDDARAAFDTALQYGVNNPADVLHTAGMLEIMQQRWGEAAARFEQAVSLDESFVRGYAILARTRAEQGRFEEAHAALDWAARLGIDAAKLAAARRHVADLQAAAGGAP